jgi:pilus assembly protein Flp/PilA
MELLRALGVRLHRDGGATMVEYGLMVALIAIVALAAVAAIGGGVTNIFCTIAGALGGGGC